MTDLRLEAVSKVYRAGDAETAALRDVDLRVRDGEFFTLVGPSGCGKTTTLRLIAGFEAPTAGVVRFGDRALTGVPPERRDVGVVFQNYALFPHMSVAENVGYGLRFRDPPAGLDRAERVAELLELVDLEGMGERDPSELSGGQRQRVALARALAPAPSLLLLDEPMSALDARLRESLRRQVARIQSDLGITTVYVTHDQEEALAVSDRVAVMHDGRVEQVGTPQEIYRRPRTRFVAEFVGDNNVFDGTVVERTPAETTVRVDGTTFRLPPLEAAVDDDGDPDRTVERDALATDGTRIPDAGDRLTFCVRPEALEADRGTNRVSVAVDTTEFLGESVRVHGWWTSSGSPAGEPRSRSDSPIVLRTDEVPDADEAVLTVGFDPEDAHVVGFDRGANG